MVGWRGRYHLRRLRHRHWHDPGAAWPALPGVLAGRVFHPEHVRRDRPRPRDQPPLLPTDGRRPHRRERLRPGHDVHHPTADRRGGARASDTVTGQRLLDAFRATFYNAAREATTL